MEKRKYNILIVDDEASNLHILNQILKEDYRVYAARNGAAALRIAGEKSPDLILLDVVLPDIDGYEVLEGLKSAEGTADIPVVFISGLSGVENEEKGIRMGAVGYVVKPFNTAVVREKVEAILR